MIRATVLFIVLSLPCICAISLSPTGNPDIKTRFPSFEHFENAKLSSHAAVLNFDPLVLLLGSGEDQVPVVCGSEREATHRIHIPA